jgi:putative transcriptional regulator
MNRFVKATIEALIEARKEKRGGRGARTFSGAEIKALRESLNLTQRAFATDFGYSITTVRAWENERRQANTFNSCILELITKEPNTIRGMIAESKQERKAA